MQLFHNFISQNFYHRIIKSFELGFLIILQKLQCPINENKTKTYIEPTNTKLKVKQPMFNIIKENICLYIIHWNAK